MRNDPMTSGNSSCNCRAISRSEDGGETWSPVTFDESLVDSICEASITRVGNVTVFFNPAMKHARNQPTLRFSKDYGMTWSKSVLVADAFSDYSAMVREPLKRYGDGKVGGLVWGSCTHPLPFRVWCTPVEALHSTFWTVLWTPFDVPVL